MTSRENSQGSRRIVIGPFNRVEGDLEVHLEAEDGVVSAAYVNSPLYRGFEQILLGKVPLDALVITPRICGICSVSQSAASARALENAMGIQAPPNGMRAANLSLAIENVADHLTHFYLYFMPDFAHAAYAGNAWFEGTQARFAAISGQATAEFLPARTEFMRALGLLAGKWPHTLSLQPGGSSCALQATEKLRIYRQLRATRSFLERVLFGAPLESVALIDSLSALRQWAESLRKRGVNSDMLRFLSLADDLKLMQLGRATDVFMSYGAYDLGGGHAFRPGLWQHGPLPLAIDEIREDTHYAWYAEGEAVLSPRSGVTLPSAEKLGAYSWCKAPRLGGRVVETGALARQIVDAHPLALDMVEQGGGNVFSRVVARLLEVSRLIPLMEYWADSLQPGEPYMTSQSLDMPGEAESFGLVEAARGSLGHWITIRRGRIHNYQIIAPTTWNFSPRDSEGIPGALEQALVGIDVAQHGGATPAVQHVVRSFDPCMVCTVH